MIYSVGDEKGKCSSLYALFLCPWKSSVVQNVKYLKALEQGFEAESFLSFVVLVWYISGYPPEPCSFSVVEHCLGWYSQSYQ